MRANKNLVEIMARNDHPFSLLGKLQTYDFGNPDEDLFVITKPVLVIPGAEDSKLIDDWEEANTTYEKEIDLFFLKYNRKIPKFSFLS